MVKILPPGAAGNTERPIDGQTMPLALAFLLPLLAVSFHYGHIAIYLKYFAIPIAAWLGYRYRRSGVIALAFGLLPLLYKSPVLETFSLTADPGLYVVSLFVCWAFAQPQRWWKQLEVIQITNSGLLALFVLGGASFGFRGDFGQFGWGSGQVLLPFAGFVLGLSAKDVRPVLFFAIVIGLLGIVLTYSELHQHSVKLEGGLEFVGGYYYNSLPDVLVTVVLLTFGRHLAGALRGEAPKDWIGSWLGYLVFAVLWLYAFYWVGISYQTGTHWLTGSKWLVLALAFIAGMTWQNRSKVILAAALMFSVSESVRVVILEGQTRFSWALSDGESLDLRLIDIRQYLHVYLATIPFCYLGIRLARSLELAPAGGIAHSFRAKWSYVSLFTKWFSAGYLTTAVPWLLAPLMPLLVMSYFFGEGVGFQFEYLVIPFAAWIALRYGPVALWALALGAITFWAGLKQGSYSFRLSPDLYVMALIVAWAITHPDRWLEMLQKVQFPRGTKLLVLVLLPVAIVATFNGVRIGWHSELLFPFVLFVLGWAGKPARSVIGLVVTLGVAGLVARFVELSIDSSDLSIYYGLNSIQDILELTLWYFAGLVLNHSYFHIQRISDATSSDGECTLAEMIFANSSQQFLKESVVGSKAYIGIGITTFMAPFYLSFHFPTFSFHCWGSEWLIMLGAFMAGFLWGRLGMHLIGAVVAVLWFVTFLIFPTLLHDSSIVWELDSLLIEFRTPNESYIFIALPALLYCVIGIRLSEWLIKTRKKKGADLFSGKDKEEKINLKIM